MAASHQQAQVVFTDVGPNLGAINRAALIAANAVVIPLAPDLFSIQGLKNLGPTLQQWRADWRERLQNSPDPAISLPKGDMQPLGYVVLQHGIRDLRPVKAYERWLRRIPQTYRSAVLGDPDALNVPTTSEDPYCLALLKHHRALMPLAMEAHKPMFHLKPADGAIGAHVSAVQDCYRDFHALAKSIAAGVGVMLV